MIYVATAIAMLVVAVSLVTIAIIRKDKKHKNPCKDCRPRNRVCIGCPVALRKEYDHGRNRGYESSKKGDKRT